MPRLKSIAVHEAGHAVLTLLEGLRFGRITIVARGRTAGAVQGTVVRHEDDDENLRIKLAGVMAQRMCYQRWHSRLSMGAEGDFVGVADFLRGRMNCDSLLEWNVQATHEQLLARWGSVARIARALSSKPELSYDEAKSLFDASQGTHETPPGRLDDQMWIPMVDRIRWHIKHPGGLDAFLIGEYTQKVE